MKEILTIQEAAITLNYKDLRSVERWCERNGVVIFSDAGSNRKYLMRMQFEYARHLKFIRLLKLTYKDKWLEAFQAYMNMNLVPIVEMEERGKGKAIVVDKCKTSGRYEKQFNERLTKIIREQ